jgi:hypothetical protein
MAGEIVEVPVADDVLEDTPAPAGLRDEAGKQVK